MKIRLVQRNLVYVYKTGYSQLIVFNKRNIYCKMPEFEIYAF